MNGSAWLRWLKRNTAGRCGRQVLLAEHVEVDADRRHQQPGPRRGEEVDADAAVARQQPEPEAARGRGHQRRDARDGAQLRHRAAAAAAGEPQDRPTPLDGDGFHLARRDWSAAGCRPGTSARRPRRRRRRSSSWPGRRRSSAANACTARALPGPQMIGVCTSPVIRPSSSVSNLLLSTLSMPRNLATGSTWTVSADELRTTVWPRAMCARTRSRISGIDALLHVLDEQSLAELVEVAHRVAVQHPGALADEVLELRAAELVVEPGLHHADELADAHLAAPQPILRHQHAGEAGDQRAVEVEERADLGTLRAGLDLGDRARQAQDHVRVGLSVLRTHCAHSHWPRWRPSVGARRRSAVNEAGVDRPSPPSASTSSKPASRHRAHSASSVIDGPVVAGGDGAVAGARHQHHHHRDAGQRPNSVVPQDLRTGDEGVTRVDGHVAGLHVGVDDRAGHGLEDRVGQQAEQRRHGTDHVDRAFLALAASSARAPSGCASSGSTTPTARRD